MLNASCSSQRKTSKSYLMTGSKSRVASRKQKNLFFPYTSRAVRAGIAQLITSAIEKINLPDFVASKKILNWPCSWAISPNILCILFRQVVINHQNLPLIQYNTFLLVRGFFVCFAFCRNFFGCLLGFLLVFLFFGTSFCKTKRRYTEPFHCRDSWKTQRSQVKASRLNI